MFDWNAIKMVTLLSKQSNLTILKLSAALDLLFHRIDLDCSWTLRTPMKIYMISVAEVNASRWRKKVWIHFKVSDYVANIRKNFKLFFVKRVSICICCAFSLINPWNENLMVILKWTHYVYFHTFSEC